MNIKDVISQLQKCGKSHPDMNVCIFLSASKDGVLANNNFVFHRVDSNELVLISPDSLQRVKELCGNDVSNQKDDVNNMLVSANKVTNLIESYRQEIVSSIWRSERNEIIDRMLTELSRLKEDADASYND